MKYSIVIPTYNNCEKYLKPCIDSIIKYTDMDNVELVVSANGCTDNTRQYLDYLVTAIPNLYVAWNDIPLGFAKATNKGIKVCKGNKIVLLNNDTVILDKGWLEKLDSKGDI
jgi:glycosyltransferase involved in cell wall biosynthesis